MGTGMIGMQWIIFIGVAVVSWLVQMNLQSKFKKYSKIPTGNGMTGADVALKMLHDNGIYDVTVTHTPGHLTDHYNPANKTVTLAKAFITATALWQRPLPPMSADMPCSMHAPMHRLRCAASWCLWFRSLPTL